MKQKIKQNSVIGGPKNIVFVVIFFLVCIGLLTKLADYTRQIKQYSYFSFLDAVEHDHVKAVHVSGQDVTGILKDGTKFEATIPKEHKTFEVLRAHNVDCSIATSSGQLNFWHLILIFLFLMIPLAIWYFMRQSRNMGNSGSSIFSMGKNKAKLFMPSTVKVNFSSVAGAHEAKEQLKDVVDYLKNPEKYRRLGAKVPRGVLLVGEPGNGKTLLAKAVAGEANCPFFSITGSDFIEVFVGVGAARVRDLFAQARKHAPSIVFIDEIDAIGRQRGTGFGGGHDEREQTLNQLLTEMDGFDTAGSSVIVVAATNMPDVLDKALLRPGRFDRRIDVPFPDADSREQILRIHAQGVKIDSEVDLRKIAEKTAGFSGADLSNLINIAALNASKKNQDTVTMKDLEDAHRTLLEAPVAGETSSNPLIKGNSKARMFMPSQIKVTFNDVAGLYEAKEEVKDIIDYLKDSSKFKKIGAKISRGVLLIGEPGNGKTLLARAIAGEANCPFFSVSASEFVEMFVGVGASRVRDLFTQARKQSPCIVFIDEIDAVGSRRVTGHGGHEERNQTLNQLLTEMDGFSTSEKPIIVMAATNRADVLDKALLRPGRFDRHVEIPYPDLVTREEILKVHLKDVKTDDSVDVSKLARGTGGFSGAALATLVNEAAINAVKRSDNSIVTKHDFEEARDKLTIGKLWKSRIPSEQERNITAYHEAGHTLVILLTEKTYPLHKVTILPRGCALGVTHSLPERDQYLETREEALAHIDVGMGGRAAEELIFNTMTAGAGNDFSHATNHARLMVRKYGMSDVVGPVIYNENDSYSQKTAEMIDREVQNILEQSLRRVKDLLQNNIDKLHMIAKKLLEKETLEAEEIYDLVGITGRQSFKL